MYDPEEQKLGSDLASVDLPIPPCLWRAPTANTVTSVGGAESALYPLGAAPDRPWSAISLPSGALMVAATPPSSVNRDACKSNHAAEAYMSVEPLSVSQSGGK